MFLEELNRILEDASFGSRALEAEGFTRSPIFFFEGERWVHVGPHPLLDEINKAERLYEKTRSVGATGCC